MKPASSPRPKRWRDCCGHPARVRCARPRARRGVSDCGRGGRKGLGRWGGGRAGSSFWGAASEAERERLWQGRKKAFGAMGRLSRDLVVQDAVVPRSALPHVLETIADIARRYDLVVSNVFHAGDGNLHPNISFDATDDGMKERVERASAEIMGACIAAGGTITGEHGIGIDKLRYMPLIFDAESLGAMQAVRRVFDPEERVNPGKVIPVHACREWTHMRHDGVRRSDESLHAARRTPHVVGAL